VTASSVAVRSHALQRALCLIVRVIVVLAVIYATWIGIGNFSRIGV
jgi:hypothetical protein